MHGHLAAVEIDNEDESRIPLDLTTISNRRLGAIHSEWAVRHGFILTSLAGLEARLVELKYAQRQRKNVWMIQRSEAGGPKYAKVAEMEQDPDIAEYDEEITVLEASVVLARGIAEGAQAYREAASREITRRSFERAPND